MAIVLIHLDLMFASVTTALEIKRLSELSM